MIHGGCQERGAVLPHCEVPMSDPYAHLREEAENAFGKDSLQRLEPIFDIRDELYSMSPFKVWMLLEQALGDQGSNALIVTRDQYYRAVVDEMPEITERCSGDIDEFS